VRLPHEEVCSPGESDGRAPGRGVGLRWLLMLLALATLAGCATEASVSSQRSLALTPERLAKGGSVCVMDLAKMKGLYPDAREARQTKIAEDFFRSKGFRIAPRLAGADYAFWGIGNIKTAPVSGATVIGNEVLLNRNYLHSLTGYFYSVRRNGGPEKELWQGSAYWSGSGHDPWGTQEVLLQSVLNRFPN
jgi:hypothetical protein